MVKELTGLKINHVINIDFLGFVRAVDAIGCVYTDVDRRYYHSNVGLRRRKNSIRKSTSSPATRSSAAKKRSQYVRYRHTDTDIVRSARQQNFLSQARHQVSPTDLITDNHNLIDILTEYTTSDINGGTELITLLDLLYELKGAEVNQVHFPAELGPELRLRQHRRSPPRGEGIPRRSGLRLEAARNRRRKGGKKEARKRRSRRRPKKKSKNAKGKKKHHKKKHHTPPGGDELVPAAEAGQADGRKRRPPRRRRLPGLLPDPPARRRHLPGIRTPTNTSSTRASTT